MARHARVDWDLADSTIAKSGRSTLDFANVHTALLMDIRDELYKLNRVLACPDFLCIPSVLRQISTHTRKHRPSRKALKRSA